MNTGKTVFSQTMEFPSIYEFPKCVGRYQGDDKIKSLLDMKTSV